MVVYHADDKHGLETAALLTKKGFPHLLLLSGGIEEFGVHQTASVEGTDIPEFLPNDLRDLTRPDPQGRPARHLQGDSQESEAAADVAMSPQRRAEEEVH